MLSLSGRRPFVVHMVVEPAAMWAESPFALGSAG